mmetsp:Transcript_10727/g.16445  ORF Transcript_10727/g.16445 Transcript_10727/m.16445 type:complete len:590 (+) Transcript_10727:66-1835(+)|eukprot:CAMPEP_0178906818 /NCGR_PEP_ID=MMETSP0786-20121207/7029_1 /TAXON_ID=186022 /ORGANISM="Thalassionema frauenfeldii, Strain CCMP 1798" /LENGTH=589 /DNA_ID=CAMNT_0020578553 /DNA_START=11 /DNA_END=1783 /DNA_ORIENTATION=-
MSSSDDSSSSGAAAKLEANEERDWDEWENDKRKSSGKSEKRTWPSSESEVSGDEDNGWEDWDEDQRRALGKSHQRTLGSLEEGTPRSPSISSIRSGVSVPTAKDPKGQILPSDRSISRQEEEAKKRRHVKDDPIKPATKFVTKACVVLTVVGLLCLIAAVAITIVVPYGSLKQFVLPMLSDGNSAKNKDDETYETILPVQLPDRYVEQIQSSASGTTVIVDKPSVDNLVEVQVTEGEDSVSTSQIPPSHTNPQVDVVDKNDDDDLGFVSKFFKSVATYIGLESKVTKNTKSDLIVPEYVAYDLAGESVPNFENLYSLTEEPVVDTQPVLWLTQRSASGTLKEVLTFCYGLVLACDSAVSHEEALTLEILSTPDNSGHFVNVNTETKEGLIRAQNIGVIDSHLVQVIATPFIVDASSLFNRKTRTGRVFALLRHPVEQTHSDFLYRRNLPAEDSNYIPPELTLAQFVESELLMTNPLTRSLLNVTRDTLLSEGHTYLAKRILEERVLVGLVESFHESVHRFENYFGWNLRDPVCVTNFETARDQRQDHEQLSQSSLEWKTISDRNYADMELYQFGKTMFEKENGLSSINS